MLVVVVVVVAVTTTLHARMTDSSSVVIQMHTVAAGMFLPVVVALEIAVVAATAAESEREREIERCTRRVQHCFTDQSCPEHSNGVHAVCKCPVDDELQSQLGCT